MMKFFDNEIVRDFARRYMDGEDSDELWSSDFGSLLDTLRFVPISEQDAESMHAVTHRHAGKAPNHTEEYISFRQRMSAVA